MTYNLRKTTNFRKINTGKEERILWKINPRNFKRIIKNLT